MTSSKMRGASCLLRWQKEYSKQHFLSLRLSFNAPRGCKHCDDSMRALGLYFQILVLYGLKNTAESREAFDREFINLHALSKSDLSLKYWKYKTAAMFSYAFDQDLPEFPSELVGQCTEGPHVVGGIPHSFILKLKRNVKSKDVRVRQRSWSAFNSILMLKKGLPRPSVQNCKDAAVKAYLTMTTEVKRKDGDADMIEEVAQRVDKVVKHLFGTRNWNSFWEDISISWPSVKSHFDCSRADLGGLGGLISNDKGEIPVVEYVDDYSDDLILPNDLKYRVKISEETVHRLKLAQVNLVEKALLEAPFCMPQALPEPLKIRIVTCGPRLLYHSLRPIQKMMSEVLKSDKRFLYGEEISGKALHERLGWLIYGNKWCSGDYQAATDNIAIELSERCVVAIAKATHMPADYVDLLMRSLTQHFYVMDDPKTDVRMETLEQKRGQLMGSPTSFPILCILNFALIWNSVFPTQEFRELQMLVNGDDCLFQTDKTGFNEWSRQAEAIGLKPSVGKTYFDERFMVMNSTMYDVTYENPEGYDKIPFINTGLLLGLKRSGDREQAFTSEDASKSGDQSVGARARKLVEGNDWCASELMDLFIEFNDIPDVPLIIPEVWGGLGLPETDRLRMPIEEYLMLKRLLDEQTRFFPLKSEGSVSPYYQSAVNGLKRRYGKVRKETREDFTLFQWEHIFEKAQPQEGNRAETESHWLRWRTRLLDEYDEGLLVFEPASINWDEVRRGPPKEVPGVWITYPEDNCRTVYQRDGAFVVIDHSIDRNEVFVPSTPPMLSTSMFLDCKGHFEYDSLVMYIQGSSRIGPVTPVPHTIVG